MKITLENIPHNNHHIYKKYPFVSKILFIDGKSVYCIIDNYHPKAFSIYLLDHYDTDFKEELFEYALEWYKAGHKIPISIFFESKNIKPYVEEIANIVYHKSVTQIDGYVFQYPQYENITNKLTLSEGTQKS